MYEAINTKFGRVILCTSASKLVKFHVFILRIAEVRRGRTFCPPFALGLVRVWHM
jgi:hypothetical protein